MSRLEMMRVLKFTTDDLQANRDGRMSETQQKKYQPTEINWVVYAVVFGHLAVIGGILGAIAIVTGEAALWIVLGIVTALGALPFIMLKNEGNIKPLLKNDVKRGQVKQTCGYALLEQKQGRRIYFELTIEGVTMQLTAAQAAAFQYGETYCAYYLPGSRTLLTAEPQ